MKFGGVELQAFGFIEGQDAPQERPPEAIEALNRQLKEKNLIPEIHRQLLKEGLVTTEEAEVKEEGKPEDQADVQPPKPAPAPGK